MVASGRQFERQRHAAVIERRAAVVADALALAATNPFEIVLASIHTPREIIVLGVRFQTQAHALLQVRFTA